MTETPQFNSLKDFYPYYLSEHSLLSTRITHFIGTSLLFVIIVLAIVKGQYNLLWFLPLAGYSFAWFGHFFFEKNKPATFKYPFYSLASDFIMFWHMLTFQIGEEMQNSLRKYPKS
jgi:hypothetical protein